MGLPGRPSLARILALSVVLSALPLAPPAAGTGRTRVVELDRGADVRSAARRLADRPGVAFAEPDWVRRVDACDPEVCWHLQPRPGANVVAAHGVDHRGGDRTVAVVDTGVMAAVPDNPATRTSTSPTTSTSGTGSPRAGAAGTPAASRPWPRPPAPTAPRWPA